MAVLVEAISVIVRRDAIKRAYDSGWKDFLEDVPNETICSDNELARVGFMYPDEVERYIERLFSRGLTFLSKGKCVDIAVVDQQRGPTMPCEWLEFARLPFGDSGGKVSACWFFDGPRIANGIHIKGESLKLATPSGWEFATSLSAKFTFIPNERIEDRLEYLRTEDGIDVFRDKETGKEVFMASHREDEA